MAADPTDLLRRTILPRNALHSLLLPSVALLAYASVSARAADGAEPESVGQRFEWANRAQAIVVDGWDVRPSATAVAGYDSNITLTGGDGPSSSDLKLRAGLDADRGIGAYRLDLNASLGQTWYPDASENDLTEADVRTAVTYDEKPLILRGAVAYQQGAERSINNGIFVDGVFDPYTTRPEFRRVPLEATLDYELSRVLFEAGVRAVGAEYESETTVSGFNVSQDFRNGWQEEFRLRGGYEVTSDLAFFAEGRASTTQYRDSQGDRDSWSIVAGSSFEFTRLLVGEASAGYTELTLASGGRTSGFTYAARLHWFVTELVSLTLNGERRFDGEVVTTALAATSAGPVTHDLVSVRAEWEPLRQLYIHAEAGYENDKREGSGQSNDLISLNTGATYVLTNSLKLTIDGTYESGTSDFTADVDRHSVAVGIVASF
jgi:Putative beta-barrel porin 2